MSIACGMMDLSMFSGKLDKLITIQTNTPSQDGFGEPVASWSTLATVWAERMNPKVSEKFTGSQDAGFKSIDWRVRYRGDITNLMRVSFGGQIYDIKGVIDVGRNHYHILQTESVVV